MGHPPELDALCIGETMAMLTPADGRPLAGGGLLRLDIGGAESNVACGLAALGHRAGWLSRLGADPFGDLVRDTLAGRGVQVHAEADPDRPTGVYFKNPGPGGTQVHYYRAGSAASALGPADAGRPVVAGARLVHLSGVSPVLSASCAALVEQLLGAPRAGRLVSFDVNFRPALWPAAQAGPVLLELARRADVVLVGRDEAATVWGADTAQAVRELLPDVPTLVVKDAEHRATSFDGAVRTDVPSPTVHVVEPVGSGDAFAAGYLSGLLDGRPPVDRLRLGHLLAAETLRCPGDLAVLPDRAALEQAVALPEAGWDRLEFGEPAGIRP